ncbi:energy-coupling factor transport system ATP-binding protein [Geothermobacter ehrlichii]|uniref:Energy-coupling factor transport system ATP-binding protein n=1 Tax=Geothermobacter ehrlichii TaxID=213224 RepID=A0A5D3WLN9_9BACT|nr:energy-coupling factor transporter ATPase [Geothermobacter ehrlichii]TYO99184.1 energy-coupling factor transport system ATP-binding protein [Geothermobacter ehrlichii]
MHDLNRPAPLPNPGESLFALRGVEYAYPGGFQALRGIDLSVAPGDRLALVGHNGSGKTTLVKQLCGLLAPDRGEVFYKGSLLRKEHLSRARLEIGLLFQDPDDQLFCHSLLEDVAFGPRNQGLSAREAEIAAKRALQQVDLLDLVYKPPHALSYGQKKRAALAGLLAMRPEVLILDEPTANLDPRQEAVFVELLRDYAGTLIIISHDLLFLYELCDRAVVLDAGHIHHDYSMRELVSHRASLREHGLDFSFRFAAEPMETGSDRPADSARSETVADPEPEPAAKPAGRPLIELEDFHFSYPDGTRALRGIDLQIDRGERVALVGENGAGKSTLLACLLGIHQGRGSYRFAGRPVDRRNLRQLWRKISLVFQDCSDQLFCASVFDEVAFGPRQLGYSELEVERRVGEALAKVRLQGFEKRIPLKLSGGERKRLALASVLALDPEVLVLDEPTAGLDPQGEELLLDILRQLDCTLLLVTHDMFFVRNLTSRTLVMHKGTILRDLPTGAFLDASDLASLNGLDYTYRDRCALEIRQLQHVHEHSHRHRHLHEHEHRHGDLVHCHPHEHEHEHSHSFVHRHDADDRHEHPPTRLYHDHEHPDHDREPHDHEH